MATDFVYNSARTGFATAQINWLSLPINAMLVNENYSPLPGDAFVSNIPSSAIIVRDLLLTNLGVKNGVCFGTIPEIDGVTSAFPAAAVILYVLTNDDATSRLIYFSSTGPGFPFDLQGFSYFVGFDQSNGGYFQV
jgi:hypothetical protein